MTTHHTDAKKPARCGFWKKRELEKPRFRLYKWTYWTCEGMGVEAGGYSAKNAYLVWRAKVGPLSIGERLRLIFLPFTLEWAWMERYPYL